jgi:uncharacterized protein with HEPN domain
MVDAAREALSFVSGRRRADLEADRQLVLALVKCIEIVGEAACQVTASGRDLLPGMPWPSIVAMRHRLVHAYFDIDRDLVWATITVDLPPLVTALEHRLRELSDTSAP